MLINLHNLFSYCFKLYESVQRRQECCFHVSRAAVQVVRRRCVFLRRLSFRTSLCDVVTAISMVLIGGFFFHSKFFSLCISLDIDYLIFRWRSCSVIVTWAKKEKVRTKRASIVLDGNPSRSYGASPTIWDHLKIPRYSVPAALSVSTTGNAIFFYSTFITEQSSLYSLSAQSATFLPTVCLPVGSKI